MTDSLCLQALILQASLYLSKVFALIYVFPQSLNLVLVFDSSLSYKSHIQTAIKFLYLKLTRSKTNYFLLHPLSTILSKPLLSLMLALLLVFPFFLKYPILIKIIFYTATESIFFNYKEDCFLPCLYDSNSFSSHLY